MSSLTSSCLQPFTIRETLVGVGIRVQYVLNKEVILLHIKNRTQGFPVTFRSHVPSPVVSCIVMMLWSHCTVFFVLLIVMLTVRSGLYVAFNYSNLIAYYSSSETFNVRLV